MKKLSTLLVGSILLFPAALLHAAPFEGKVGMKMTDAKGKATPLNFSVKEGLSRIDMDGGQGGQNMSMIMDSNKKEMTMLMNTQKMYMVMPLNAGAAAAAAGGSQPAPASDVALDKTGTVEKILGYDCTKYVATTKEGSVQIWITEQLGTFTGFGASNPMAGRRGGAAAGAGASLGDQAWAKYLAGKDMFPMRVVVNGVDGKETMRMETVSVEKQSLPASLFVAPEGWQNLSDMMKGMGGMGGMSGMGGMPGMMPGGMRAPGN